MKYISLFFISLIFLSCNDEVIPPKAQNLPETHFVITSVSWNTYTKGEDSTVTFDSEENFRLRKINCKDSSGKISREDYNYALKRLNQLNLLTINLFDETVCYKTGTRIALRDSLTGKQKILRWADCDYENVNKNLLDSLSSIMDFIKKKVLQSPKSEIPCSIHPYADLIPLKVGNYWIYSDTAFTDSYSITIDTLKILSTEIHFGHLFYFLNYGNYSNINDTIFSFANYWGQESRELVYAWPDEQGILYTITSGGDHIGLMWARLVKSNYMVGKHIFPEYIEYINPLNGPLITTTIIVPGIGIVETISEIKDESGSVIKRYKHSLMDYHLN